MLLRLVPILLLAAARAWSQSPAIPDTPAGHTLQAWLDAFNSGDRARIQGYYAKYEPTKAVPVGAIAAWRDRVGGYDVLGVDKSDRLHIEFRAKEKDSPIVVVGKLEVRDGNPATVVSFPIRAIPPGMTAADMSMKIDPAARGRVIDGTVASLNEFYVFPEVAKKMEQALRARQKKGEYDAVEDAEAFAELLTDHLQQISHDKHLNVNFSPAVLPKDLGARNPDGDARMRTQMERDNCLFQKAERLSSNIGYLKFNAFLPPDTCGPTAIAAMNFLGNVDAIIFDLRDNGGGDPKMVALITTYLFDQPTHLNDIYNRKEDATTQFWTLPYVPGKRLAGKPVFVLTSTYTFSAAEDFAYNIKELKRGTIIGETTGGGAHPVSGQRIDDHFMIGVPSARSVSPISKTNWEGTGVEPDIKVPADQALEVAKEKAADQIKNAPANKK
jgi:hypothetical protein